MAVYRFIMGVAAADALPGERFLGKRSAYRTKQKQKLGSRKQKSALFRIKMAFSLLGNERSGKKVVKLRRMDGLGPASQIWDLARRHARPVRTPGPQGRGGEFLGVWQVPEPLVL